MLHQLINIPYTQPFYLACSGGVDSMAIADFYHRGNKNFTLAYFHHGTPQADQMESQVRTWASMHHREVTVGHLSSNNINLKTSPEDFYRQARYQWLTRLQPRLPIVTCHHLNDAVETWIFSSCHGQGKLIPMKRDHIYRPFLTTPKSRLLSWCQAKKISWVEDRSNQDLSIPRNLIRHQLLPLALKINPGLMKTIKKKYLMQDLTSIKFS